MRKNLDPDMFYKVYIEENKDTPKCMPFLILEILANVIKEYIQTIVIQMCLMPIAILNLYFYFTDRQPYGDDLKFLRLSRGSSIVVFMISYFLLALRK